ncbi:MAG TPA: PIN domain-containing protein [Candidatus Dormibacteraeota bacterium]|nr:PIN domain-containing protein [Candidatus Dormibacteraeota bacterium]
MALICDTGPLYGALDRSDADHAACASLLSGADGPIVVPAPVVIELEWLASSRLEPSAFLAFLADVEAGTVVVAELERADYTRIRRLLERYGDLPLGFVDAAVLAVVERFGERRLATLDHRHFSVVRPRHVPSLELVP